MSVGSTIMRMRQAKSSLNSTNVRHMARVSLDLVLVGWKNMSDRKVRETRHKKDWVVQCLDAISQSYCLLCLKKRERGLKSQLNHNTTIEERSNTHMSCQKDIYTTPTSLVWVPDPLLFTFLLLTHSTY
jgi:hypothetical protein